ncbi:MAG: 50S ribosomal protein L18 [Candidatus Portnoybacteria bacterium]|nr:50S ribosomal protein L18 [Candidatus Portnoybacteria bacterium]
MPNKMKAKRQKRARRHRKIRARIFGTSSRPRLAVFRSNRHIYGQLIDDQRMSTLINISDLNIERAKGKKKIDLAKEIGMLLAKKALEKKIEKIVFDRAGFKFHGRIKAVAEGAREGGLKF